MSVRLPLILFAACLLGATRPALAAPPDALPAAASAPVVEAIPPASVDARKPLAAQALEACEASVSDSLRTLRGPGVHQVDFDRGPPMVVSSEDEVPLKGGGRYVGGVKGGAVPFTYGCNYNVRTGKTNGIVVSDGKDAVNRLSARGKGGGTGGAWQPDLASVSPEACEASVAGLLKNRHPRVGRITFDPQSRQLKPAASSAERTLLQGQGGMQRAPGMLAEAFTYRCEFDHRSGNLGDVRLSE